MIIDKIIFPIFVVLFIFLMTPSANKMPEPKISHINGMNTETGHTGNLAEKNDLGIAKNENSPTSPAELQAGKSHTGAIFLLQNIHRNLYLPLILFSSTLQPFLMLIFAFG